MPRWILLAIVVLACTPRERPLATEVSTVASAKPAEPPPPEEEDPTCESPEPIAAVDTDARGALDEEGLARALGIARDFGERCCNGDATERTIARVRVTLHGTGYATDVAIEGVPENGPAHACLYGSFHRVLGKTFVGASVVRTVNVRVRP